MVFQFFGTLVSFYCLACFVRLILVWFPGAALSPAGRFLSRVCDPYLNFFRRFRFLRTSQLDFSPVLALAVLGGASSILARIGTAQRVSLGFILGSIVQILWSVASSLFFVLLIVTLVRLAAQLFAPQSRSQFILGLDRILYPIMRPVSAALGGKQSWTVQLAVGAVFIFLARTLLGYIVGLITALLINLPF
ncbi:MAG: YggT family protein [Spirochaetaceae bacterium]|jgi:YggT family protein|nr:YggT family protein [Spirochaetaceae bacterium]